ncbi:MAG: histidine phosphatase family protein [Tractidigestivibacter sp.]|jgi:broad specificity phosphatase PhoE|uniref:histidine phosphatase family protein n=1 Tax=Tractidigestivibacter sp. TaxID=2847320 RepID=UPI003D8AB51E
MKRVRFFYVRHGETLFNVMHRMQGWCDSPLTEKGVEDARAAGALLAGVPLSAAYVSTSERCRDTCALVLEGRDDVPVYERKGLKEVFYGTWEGVKVDDHLDEINRRRGTGIHWDDCGGDSDESFARRVRKTYTQIFDERDDGDNVLIVSHGAAWLWLQRVLFGIDPGEFGRVKKAKGLPKLPNGYNGSFTCTDGVWRLESVPGLDDADVLHLMSGESN